MSLMGAVLDMFKTAAPPPVAYALKGRLYLSKSGWILLSVPNAVVRGLYDAINEPGVELPPADETNGGRLNAHISVMRPEELDQVDGGANAITERGHEFSYNFGPLRTVEPDNSDHSRIWYVEVKSPTLEKLRKSYGLSATPNEGKHQFHLTVAVRRKNVLRENGTVKGIFSTTFRDGTDAKEPQGSRLRKVGNDLYHGSPTADIEELEPRPHKAVQDPSVFATPDRLLALAMSRPSEDDDLGAGYSNGQFNVDELRPGALEQLRGPATLYNLPDEGFEPHEELMPEERVNKQPVKPHSSEQIQDVLAELQAAGVVRGYDDVPSYMYEGDEPVYTKPEMKDMQSVLAQLRQAKEHSDKKEWGAKTAILRQQMQDNPGDWIVDNTEGAYYGITHVPSGFKFHLPPAAIPNLTKQSSFPDRVDCGFCDHVVTTKLAAAGIPNQKDLGDLSKLKPGLVDFYIQQHAAERAGDHFDVRFGLPDTGLYSFATRKELPKPGERRALFQQPVHSHEYGTFEGEIKCVPGDTLIQCSDGLRPIKNLQPERDQVQVLAIGPFGLDWYNVKRLYRHVRRRHWLRLHFQAPQGEHRTLVCGLDHGIYVLGQGFIDAKHLAVGDSICLEDLAATTFALGMAGRAQPNDKCRVVRPCDNKRHEMMERQSVAAIAAAASYVSSFDNSSGNVPTTAVMRSLPYAAPADCFRSAQCLDIMAIERRFDRFSACSQIVRYLVLCQALFKIEASEFVAIIQRGYRGLSALGRSFTSPLLQILSDALSICLLTENSSKALPDGLFAHTYVAPNLCKCLSLPEHVKEMRRFDVVADEMRSSGHSVPLQSVEGACKGNTIVNKSRIIAIEPVEEFQEAFDLLVEDAHNYFANGVLTHNSGYGKGQVKQVRAGNILVTKVSPGAIHFTTADKRHSERFVLIQPEKWGSKDWLLINNTPTDPVPYEKVRYKKIPRQQVDKYIEQWQEGDTVETKIDGASSLIKLLENGVELVSYRASKETGRPIVHTERVFHGIPSFNTPPELIGSVLKAELYGETDASADSTDTRRTNTKYPRLGDGIRDARDNALASSQNRSDTRRSVAAPRDDSSSAARAETRIPVVSRHDSSLHKPESSGVRTLRQEGSNNLQGVDGEFRNISKGHGRAGGGNDVGTDRQHKELLSKELSVGDARDAGAQSAYDQVADTSGADTLRDRLVSPSGTGEGDSRGPTTPGLVDREGGHRRIIPPYELGGILNASLTNAIRRQKERDIKLRLMVYDIQQLGKKPVDWHKTPRGERRQMIEQVLQHLPKDKFHISPAATTPEDAKQMWDDIQATGHTPATEGVVGWPAHGKPWKGKLVEDMDVHVTGSYPGEGKYRDVGIGGFTYALESGGPTVGRIGTGLSDQLRGDVFADPEAYVGRVARIQSQEQLPSGAYRAPAFMNFHEDYPLAKTSADKCPGCSKPFPEGEPYPDVDMCEVCERYGPPKKEAAAEVSLKQTIDRATRRVREPVSPAQAEAGNYRKGHFRMHGLDISIETRKGQDRKGVDRDGNPWSNTMQHHYGYIKRTDGKDGDQVDVFIGENPDTELVFVVDQVDPKTKRFDENKCLCGFNTKEEAQSAYMANYDPGWKGFQGIVPLTVDQFKEWLQHGNSNKPMTAQTFALKTAADKEDDEGVVLIIQRHTSIQVLGPKKKGKKDAPSDEGAPEIDITIEVDGDDKAKSDIELELASD